MLRGSCLRAAASALVLVGPASTAAADVEFIGLGVPPFPGVEHAAAYTRADGISGDGSTVVGQHAALLGISEEIPDYVFQGFRWSRDEGFVGLGLLGPEVENPNSTSAEDASYDGALIVGSGGSPALLWDEDAVDRIEESTFHHLWATAISADGFTIVGTGSLWDGGFLRAWRWSEGEGVVLLGDLPGGIDQSEAHDVSADGSVIVGESVGQNGSMAFRWTQEGGMQALGSLNPSRAMGVSANGQVIVGRATTASGASAFRWTAQEGMIALPLLGEARAVSGDGSIVVGEGGVWDAIQGTRSVTAFLAEHGIDASDWSVLSPSAVSDDGRVIVGNGRAPDGTSQAWVVSLPEPRSSLVLTTLSSLAAEAARRRRRKHLLVGPPGTRTRDESR